MIIYGILFYESKEGFRFEYVDRKGLPWAIQKKAWTSPTNISALEALRQLSLEGWECFSIMSMRFRKQTYYLKKNLDIEGL